MKINLAELAAAFQTSDVLQGYVDIRRGKVVLLEDEFHADAKSTERREEDVLEHIFSIEDDWENFVPIPNAYDENEGNIMLAFAKSLEEPLRTEILGSLKGSGSVGRFHRLVKKHGLAESWDGFRLDCLQALAREWCEENAIEYE